MVIKKLYNSYNMISKINGITNKTEILNKVQDFDRTDAIKGLVYIEGLFDGLVAGHYISKNMADATFTMDLNRIAALEVGKHA
ncbi:MAG: hypothetical protein J6U54_20205 [Clostridiales bacterium]|nr:hypothetical protein [Clostridiales bacterium]